MTFHDTHKALPSVISTEAPDSIRGETKKFFSLGDSVQVQRWKEISAPYPCGTLRSI